MSTTDDLRGEAERRILVLDGASGSELQTLAQVVLDQPERLQLAAGSSVEDEDPALRLTAEVVGRAHVRRPP